MSWGVFTDRNYKPTITEALEVLGSSRLIYERLLSFIENNFQVCGEFKFYGKNYGWAFRFNKSGKALIALYPGKGEFTAQIILNSKQTLDALNSDIREAVKSTITNTPEIHEGKWIFIRVNSESMTTDVEKLILIRAKIS